MRIKVNWRSLAIACALGTGQGLLTAYFHLSLWWLVPTSALLAKASSKKLGDIFSLEDVL